MNMLLFVNPSPGAGAGELQREGTCCHSLAAAWIAYYVCVLLFSEKVLKIETFFPRGSFDRSK